MANRRDKSRQRTEATTKSNTQRAPFSAPRAKKTHNHSNSAPSESAPSHDEDDIPSPHESFVASSSNSQKRKRSDSQPMNGWSSGVANLNVEVNELNQPCCLKSVTLASQLGVMAKDAKQFPLSKVEWSDESLTSKKETAWTKIKKNTGLTDESKEIVLANLGRICKNWKATVKKTYYTKYDTDEERLSICPPRVSPEDWKEMVDHWGEPETEAQSQQNSVNRTCMQDPPKSGRTSFSHVRYKLKNAGRPDDRCEVFIVTRAGDAECVAEIKGKFGSKPREEQTPEFREETFVDVVGQDRHGRVKCLGSGLCPSGVFGHKNSKYSKQRVAELESQVAEMQSANQETQQIVRAMQASMASMQGMFASVLTATANGNSTGLDISQMKELFASIGGVGTSDQSTIPPPSSPPTFSMPSHAPQRTGPTPFSNPMTPATAPAPSSNPVFTAPIPVDPSPSTVVLDSQATKVTGPSLLRNRIVSAAAPPPSALSSAPETSDKSIQGLCSTSYLTVNLANVIHFNLKKNNRGEAC